ncbi:MAG: hypothetical protein VZR00_04465 [Lachnospiraceae bacterium]|jgi:hypothetical protein|nr:hypothetical protein [Lachnospiraceae bacterium]MEE3461131.1 hypothetical protein [Lachnospiraceae bacterium]
MRNEILRHPVSKNCGKYKKTLSVLLTLSMAFSGIMMPLSPLKSADAASAKSGSSNYSSWNYDSDYNYNWSYDGNESSDNGSTDPEVKNYVSTGIKASTPVKNRNINLDASGITFPEYESNDSNNSSNSSYSLYSLLTPYSTSSYSTSSPYSTSSSDYNNKSYSEFLVASDTGRINYRSAYGESINLTATGSQISSSGSSISTALKSSVPVYSNLNSTSDLSSGRLSYKLKSVTYMISTSDGKDILDLKANGSFTALKPGKVVISGKAYFNVTKTLPQETIKPSASPTVEPEETIKPTVSPTVDPEVKVPSSSAFSTDSTDFVPASSPVSTSSPYPVRTSIPSPASTTAPPTPSAIPSVSPAPSPRTETLSDRTVSFTLTIRVVPDMSNVKLSKNKIKIYTANADSYSSNTADIKISGSSYLFNDNDPFTCLSVSNDQDVSVSVKDNVLTLTVYGKYKGDVIITLNGVSFTVNVKVLVSHFKGKETGFPYALGSKGTLKVKNLEKSMKITSSDKKVVKIDNNGKYKCKKVGVSIIKLKYKGKTIDARVIQVSTKKMLNICKYGRNIYKTCKYSQAKRMSSGYYDCSSLVWKSYHSQGINLAGAGSYAPPAANLGQYFASKHRIIKWKSSWKDIQKKKLLAGDLQLKTGASNGRYKGIYHVEMFVGYMVSGIGEDGKVWLTDCWAAREPGYGTFGIIARPTGSLK